MAVNIDTVYQKVLALANKEQRGYITPQEFNLMADKAQMDIYEGYFHDMKTAYHKPKNQTGAGDEMNMIHEKLHPFMATITSGGNGPTFSLGATIHQIDVVSYNNKEVPELSKREVLYTENNPLTKATTDRMVYVREEINSNVLMIRIYPAPTETISLDIAHWKRPTTPSWGYVVVSEKALYNANTSTNFELHASEEETLVGRILELSGIIINNQALQQSAMVDKQQTKQEQNN
tara:strand:+ start:97 stop:798 length:702 start_codon:yes stop_codon:yes gene_type:complete